MTVENNEVVFPFRKGKVHFLIFTNIHMQHEMQQLFSDNHIRYFHSNENIISH